MDVEVAHLEPLSIGIWESKAPEVLRWNDEIITSPDEWRFSLLYVAKGALTVSHQQRMTSLREGEFTFVDDSKPRTLFVYDRVTLLQVCVPHTLARIHLPAPEEIIAQVFRDPVAGHEGSIFMPLLRLRPSLKEGKLENLASSPGDDLLTDIGKACEKYSDATSHSLYAIRFAGTVKAYIETRLDDPELSIEGVAAHFRVSSRYLRSLFRGEKKLSRYIQRRRIEKAACMLADPLEQATITIIAFDCGFSSNSCFTRSFKAFYGESPRGFRWRHLQMACRQAGLKTPG